MNKKLILATFLFLTISTATIAVLISDSNKEEIPPRNETAIPKNLSVIDGKTILFYGDGCPHCLEIEAFLEEKEAVQKVNYETKEVWNDADNRKILMEKVAACQMNQDSIGVPFLWDGKNGKCLIGTDQVMEFFQKEIDSVGNE